MMCYERCCRLCLKDLLGPGIDCTSITEIRDAISILFDVKISRNDMSRCICNKCFENVMAFKAFKKTVAECQSIIQDYETIKKKIIESRTISIKEEIIDISDSESPGLGNKSKRKRPLTNPVTDSQINDILDMVHDSPSNRNSLKVNSASKKAKTVPANSTSSVPITIKKEPNTSNTPPPIASADGKGAKSTPSTSTSSKSVSNKPTPSSSNSTPKNDKRSDSLCSTSTLGVGSSLDVSKVVVKKEPGTGCEVSQSKDTNTEAVSSSVQTPTEENQTNDSEILPNSTSTPTAKKKATNLPPVRSTSVGVNNNNSIANEKSNAVASQSPAENPAPPTENGSNTKLYCNICSIPFKLEKEYENHMIKKHKSIKEDLEKSQSTKNKQSKNIKEENAVSSSEEEARAPLTRGRSSRQAKTQALKKMTTSPPKRRHSSSPAAVKKARTAQKLNSTVDSTTIAENPPSNKPDASAQSANPSAPAQAQQQKSATPKDKKRVITITLLRTKESVNFKYCDQFKNIIDFDTITPEELQDIRISLMIPEIWSNLTNVFKTSPPDDKTIEQLKNIFGDKFRI